MSVADSNFGRWPAADESLKPAAQGFASGPLAREMVQLPGRFGLGRIPARLQPTATTTLVCGFCSTGCGLTAHLRDHQAINVTPTVGHIVNRGMACPKGWESLAVLNAPDRAVTPLVRDGRSGNFRAVDWTSAVRLFCDRFRDIQRRFGRESVAFLSTGQIASEEMALLGALAKFGMDMRHGDGNTRQCMASAVVAYKEAFGFDAPPYTYQDFEESDVIVLVGSNLCIAHPIMWQRVLRNPRRPEIIVIDPRRTETAMAATQHVALQPKSDLALLYGLAHILIRESWIDRSYIESRTAGFGEFCAHVASYTPDRVSALSGISTQQLHSVANSIRAGRRVSYWWTMGVNQSFQGVRTAQAIINLALMTGSIGRPGTGANSITGQCNAMGSRLFSNTSYLLGGHDFANAAHRETVSDVLKIDVALIPDHAGWSYPEIVEGILRQRIKGLWIVGTNPAHSWINQPTYREILERLEFLVVQDMYVTTETARLADLLLPAAGWGEKEGTLINSERRLGRIKKVARAPGKALSDFAIFRLIAAQWGCGSMFADWTSPEAAFQKLKALTQGQPCDMTGVRDYRMIDELGGIQWPFTVADAERMVDWEPRPNGPPRARFRSSAYAQRRLFEDSCFYHPDGRARFVFEAAREMPEPPRAGYPYLLLTGRGTAAQWHTQTRSGKSAVLRRLGPASAYVEINPSDARREGIRPNQEVIVESQRGRIRARAFVTPAVQPGQVFMPMHYDATNQLTHAHFDPYSHQPSYKDCAVRVRRAERWDDV